jgi:hypothetical protein
MREVVGAFGSFSKLSEALEELCSEGGPLSRRAMYQAVSRPLQPGVRFFRIPLPAVPTAFLAVRLPLPAALWAYPVPHEFPSGADPSSSPAADRPWWPSLRRPLLTAYRFGSSLSALLAC